MPHHKTPFFSPILTPYKTFWLIFLPFFYYGRDFELPPLSLPSSLSALTSSLVGKCPHSLSSSHFPKCGQAKVKKVPPHPSHSMHSKVPKSPFHFTHSHWSMKGLHPMTRDPTPLTTSYTPPYKAYTSLEFCVHGWGSLISLLHKPLNLNLS